MGLVGFVIHGGEVILEDWRKYHDERQMHLLQRGKRFK